MRPQRGDHGQPSAISRGTKLPSAERNNSIGLSLAALGAFAFGTMPIFAKFAFRHGAEAVPLLAFRFSIAAILLFLFHAFTHRSFGTRSQAVRLLLLGAAGYAAESTLFFVALEHSPAAVVGLVFYSYPLWTTLLALAVKMESYRHQIALALVSGTGGVALIFSLRSTNLAGPLFALAAAGAVALYLIAVQKASMGVDPFNVALWTAAGAAISLSLLSLVLHHGLPTAALPFAAAIGLLTAIAFVALYGSISRIGSSRSSIAMMLEPVTTVVLAAIFLGESFSGRVLLGAALVVAALPLLAAAPARASGQERIDLL